MVKLGLAMLGDKISAEQAAGWGFTRQVVDDVQLMTEAEDLALHLAKQPAHGLGLIKRAMNASAANNLDRNSICSEKPVKPKIIAKVSGRSWNNARPSSPGAEPGHELTPTAERARSHART